MGERQQEIGESVEPNASARTWWNSQKNELYRDLVVAMVAGAVLLVGAIVFDRQIADRQDALAVKQADRAEVLENTRFVRQAAMSHSDPKPFSSMNLAAANLAGLPLACEDTKRKVGCADLGKAEMRGADLSKTDLRGAILNETLLERADLSQARLQRASLVRATLNGAQFQLTQLQRADLTQARLGPTELPDGWGTPSTDAVATAPYNILRSVEDPEAGKRGYWAVPGTLFVPTAWDSRDARYEGVAMPGANLRRAVLVDANLVAAFLLSANLSEADLSNANLEGAWLGLPEDSEGPGTWVPNMGSGWPAGLRRRPADLAGANLRGANLYAANLNEVDLSRVCYDDKTVWPGGVTPPPAHCERW